MSVEQFLANKRIPMYPANSLDLAAPYDFYLLSNVKSALEGAHLQFVREVIAKALELLRRV